MSRHEPKMACACCSRWLSTAASKDGEWTVCMDCVQEHGFAPLIVALGSVSPPDAQAALGAIHRMVRWAEKREDR